MALFICLADAFILGLLKAWQQTCKKGRAETQTQWKTSGTHFQTVLCQFIFHLLHYKDLANKQFSAQCPLSLKHP